jgi:hypothetical protein
VQPARRDVLAVPAAADLVRQGGRDPEAGQAADGLALGDQVTGGQDGLGAGQRDEPEINPEVREPGPALAGHPAPVTGNALKHGGLEVCDRDRPEARRRPRAVHRHSGRGKLRLGQHLDLPLRHPVAVPVRAQDIGIGRVLDRHVQAVQPAGGVIGAGQRLVQPAESAGCRLVGLMLHHHEHVDVAAGGAEVTGDQRAVQVYAHQAPALGQHVPQAPEQRRDIRGKLGPARRHQCSGK